MNPYSRFGLVSNTVSAAAILSVLAAVGPQFMTALEASTAASGGSMLTTIGGAVVVMVVFWIAMTEAIFPMLFRLNSVRKMILGKYYFEGTWLQSEKGEDHQRLSVIDIQPKGKSFIFSGYSLNEKLEIESNSLIEFSKLDWPFMTYKYRNSLSDGADGKRDGVGEIQFEMNRAAARRYNGFVQYIRSDARLRIEGAKLTSNREVKNLRTLQGRQKVFQKYWDLFFNASVHKIGIVQRAPAPVAMPAAPVIHESVSPVIRTPETDSVVIERRTSTVTSESKDAIVPRRRASDWATRQADRTQDKYDQPASKKTSQSVK